MEELFTEEELVKLYKSAKDKERQLDKLMDLTGKRRKDLIELLQRHGEALDRVENERHKTEITDAQWRKIIDMRVAGYDQRQIANTVGVTESHVQNWRKEAARLGIKIPQAVKAGLQISEQRIREEMERRKEREKNAL